jgi:hypothetical protein
MGKAVLHHVEESAFATETLLRVELVEIAGLVKGNLSFGPYLGLADGLISAIALDGIDEKSPDVVYDRGRVKFCVFTDVLIHVADVEAFASAHELAEESVTAFGYGRIVAWPRRTELAKVESIVLLGSGEVRGIASDEEQMLYGDDSVRNKIHERYAVDE